jgi:hypothetical protein
LLGCLLAPCWPWALCCLPCLRSHGCGKPLNTRRCSLPAGIQAGRHLPCSPPPGSRGHGIVAFRRTKGGAWLPLPESAWAVAVLHQIPNCLLEEPSPQPTQRPTTAQPATASAVAVANHPIISFPLGSGPIKPTDPVRFPSENPPATPTLRHSQPDCLAFWLPGFPAPNAAAPLGWALGLLGAAGVA